MALHGKNNARGPHQYLCVLGGSVVKSLYVIFMFINALGLIVQISSAAVSGIQHSLPSDNLIRHHPPRFSIRTNSIPA